MRSLSLLGLFAALLAATCLQVVAQSPSRDLRFVIVHKPGPAWGGGAAVADRHEAVTRPSPGP